MKETYIARQSSVVDLIPIDMIDPSVMVVD